MKNATKEHSFHIKTRLQYPIQKLKFRVLELQASAESNPQSPYPHKYNTEGDRYFHYIQFGIKVYSGKKQCIERLKKRKTLNTNNKKVGEHTQEDCKASIIRIQSSNHHTLTVQSISPSYGRLFTTQHNTKWVMVGLKT